MQTKITKGYRLEAVEKYKRIATCVVIFPVLGSESLADITARLHGIARSSP